MPTNSLRSALDDLASNFAAAVLAAIRGASLEELVGGGSSTASAPRRPVGRPRKTVQAKASAPRATPAKPAAAKPAKTKGGRLARRTPEDVAKTLAAVVSLLKTKKDGLRSEQIRASLKLDKREMPRVLGDGLAKKVLKSKGQKRATSYFVA